MRSNSIARRNAARWSFMLGRFDDPPAGDPPSGDPPPNPSGNPPAGDPPAGDPPATKTPEQLAAEAEHWKEMARKQEVRARENAEKAKKFDEQQAANQTELEKATSRAEAAEQLAQQRVDQAVRSEVRALADDFADRDDAIVNLTADGGLARFVGEDGEIDGEAIKEALAAKLEKKPHLKKSTTTPPPPQDPGLGPRGGGDKTDYKTADKKDFAGELAKHGLRPRSR